MVVGFNHNFRYKGEVFHVQTEDSGLKSPHIITLLYKGGTILSSKKTSYADITKVNNLEQVVEELMKEQHREMLRQLKNGEFDEIIASKCSAARPAPPAPPEAAKPKTQPAAARPRSPQPVKQPAKKGAVAEASLDEIILSYLMGEDGK